MPAGSGTEMFEMNTRTQPTSAHYGDFETINWWHDLTKDTHSWRAWFLSWLDSCSSWICVFLIGLLVGVFAGVLDVSSHFFSDFKLGVCREHAFLDREQCCWSSNVTLNIHAGSSALESTTHDNDSEIISFSNLTGSGTLGPSCDQWYSWGRLITGRSEYESGFSYFICYVFYLIFAVAYIGLCAGIVRAVAPAAAGSGLPEVKTILGGFVIRGFLGARTLFIKAVGLVLAVSSNSCIGFEGPMVHVAACCASLLSYPFLKYRQNAAKKRELLSASVAAGIAASFGAPVGGVLFSLEEASYYFPLETLFQSFFCALVAATVASVFNPYPGVKALISTVDSSWHAIELFVFAFLGIFGGVYAAIAVRLNMYLHCIRVIRFNRRPILLLVLIVLGYSLVSFPHPDLRASDRDLIRQLVKKCQPGDPEDLCDYIVPPNGVYGGAEAGPRLGRSTLLLTAALLVKTFSICVIYGTSIPTGILFPSITVGALFGRMIGVAVEQIVASQLATSWYLQHAFKATNQFVNPGLYATVGAAACLGGMTRTTLSLVVIIIEVVGGLNHILPIMVAAMFARWSGGWLGARSIYDAEIRSRHYPYLGSEGTDEAWSTENTARDIMRPGVLGEEMSMLSCDSMTVAECKQLLANKRHNGYPVVDTLQEKNLLGYVLAVDLSEQLALANDTHTVCFIENESSFNTDGVIYLSNIVNHAPITLADEMQLDVMFDIFQKMGLQQALITDKGRVCGIVTKKDILRRLDQKRR